MKSVVFGVAPAGRCLGAAGLRSFGNPRPISALILILLIHLPSPGTVVALDSVVSASGRVDALHQLLLRHGFGDGSAGALAPFRFGPGSRLDAQRAQEETNREYRGIDYSTLLGGVGEDVINDIVIRDDGVIYVAGQTNSLDFLADPGSTRFLGSDAFVIKLAPDGQSILATRVLGGSGDLDIALALRLVGGHLYMVGSTNSDDLPVSADAQQRQYGGNTDGFVAKLDEEDLSVEYVSYLGGSGTDAVTGIARSAADEVVLVGLTTSGDFLAECGRRLDSFLLRIDTGDLGVRGSLCLGGSGDEFPLAVSVDEIRGYTVIVGSTNSTDFPLEQPLQASFAGGENDAYITLVDRMGQIRSSTYWGGSEGDQAWGVATASDGDTYIVGTSYSPDFPVSPGLEMGLSGIFAGFVVRLRIQDDGLLSMRYSRLLGGHAPSLAGTGAYGVALDGADHPVIVGATDAVDFPVTLAPQPNYAGFGDGYVTMLNPDGQVEFSTFLGGSLIDNPNAVAVHGGAIVVAGVTQSSDFPLVAPVQGRPYGSDAFVTRISNEPVALECLYVASPQDKSVTIVDTSRRRVTGALSAASLAPNIVKMAASADGRLYVLEGDPVNGPNLSVTDGEASRGVAVLDTATGAFLGRFGSFASPSDLFVSHDGQEVDVIDAGGLTSFDAAQQQSLAMIPLVEPSRAAFDVTTGTAYVLTNNGSHIAVVDVPLRRIVRDMPLDRASLALDVAVAPTARLLLVVESLESRLVVRDALSGTVQWSVPVGPGAHVVTLSANERLAFVGHRYGSGWVTVIDMIAKQVIALLSFESGVEDLAVTPDGAFAFVTTGAQEQSWVIDVRTLQVIASIPIGGSAEKVAIGASWNRCRVETPCDGDCNNDGNVRVNELVTMVGILLGTLERSACPSLGNNGDPIAIDYVIRAVRASLEGCSCCAIPPR